MIVYVGSFFGGVLVGSVTLLGWAAWATRDLRPYGQDDGVTPRQDWLKRNDLNEFNALEVLVHAQRQQGERPRSCTRQ